LVFELSKVETPAIRARVVAGLRNVDDDLARRVAAGIGLADLPDALEPACEPRRDLPTSAALSIVRNGPESFAGRKIGALVTDGVDASLVAALSAVADEE